MHSFFVHDRGEVSLVATCLVCGAYIACFILGKFKATPTVTQILEYSFENDMLSSFLVIAIATLSAQVYNVFS